MLHSIEARTSYQILLRQNCKLLKSLVLPIDQRKYCMVSLSVRPYKKWAFYNNYKNVKTLMLYNIEARTSYQILLRQNCKLYPTITGSTQSRGIFCNGLILSITFGF